MSDNRREFYRVDMYDETITIYLTEDNAYKGYLEDLSGNGMGFTSEHGFSFFRAEAEFELEHRTYRWKIEMVRKTESISRRYLYAVKFVDVDKEEHKDMYQALMRLDAKKRLEKRKENE